jgi:hypothetical protein
MNKDGALQQAAGRKSNKGELLLLSPFGADLQYGLRILIRWMV